MADITYDQVVKLAEQLPETEQNKLIYHLRVKQVVHHIQEQAISIESPDSYLSPTREELIEELNVLRAAGAFEHVESLYGKYANPNAPELSEEAFHAQMHAIATEWEKELDEFYSNDD
ncbi:MAG: hypothetical protein ACYDBJ_16515 [Aggregatilineales bacterium]